MMQRLVRTLPTLCALIVGVASFALSYVALRDVAARVDAAPAYLAFLVPVVVDGGIIAGSAVIWEASMFSNRRHVFPYVFVALLVVMSVTMNVAHAGPTALAKVIASLPPLVLLGSIELVASQHMRRSAAGSAAPAAPVSSVSRDAASVTQRHPVQERAAAVPAAPATASGPAVRPAPAAQRQVAATPPTAPTAARAPLAATSVPATTPSAPSATPAAPVAGPRRQLRTRAEGPDDLSANLPEATPAAERIGQLFSDHLASGGDVDDPQLAGAIAATLELTPSYVRKLLRPLREAQATS